MERKIGEKFTIGDKTYIVKRGHGCGNCVFYNKDRLCICSDVRGVCSRSLRSDETNVIFEELEEETVKMNGMKEFNLEAAREGKPVCTRDGRKARILCFDLVDDTFKIAAAIKDGSCEKVITCNNLGRRKGCDMEDCWDLMIVGEKKKGWFAIYRPKYDNNVSAATTNVYNTKEEVEKVIKNMGAENNLIDIRQIEWEE